MIARLSIPDPRARKREQLNAKRQWNAVTEDYLSKAFKMARDGSRTYDSMPKAECPIFHEIRARVLGFTGSRVTRRNTHKRCRAMPM